MKKILLLIMTLAFLMAGTVENTAYAFGGSPPAVSGYSGGQNWLGNLGADPDEPHPCNLEPYNVFWVTYQPPSDGYVYINTIGSAYDTILGIYTCSGTCQSYSDLHQIACNDNFGSTNTSKIEGLRVAHATNYYIQISGKNGASGRPYLNWFLDPVTKAIGTIQMEGFTGPTDISVDQDGSKMTGTRVVTFIATSTNTGTYYDPNCDENITTNIVLKTWTPNLNFTNTDWTIGSAPYTLTDVPSGTAYISAKTDWSLRRRINFTFATPNVAVNFTETNTKHLLAGDIDGGEKDSCLNPSFNGVDSNDYFNLLNYWFGTEPSVDIDGNGVVDSTDYSLLLNNWFTQGEQR